jgi:hypothetical protein
MMVLLARQGHETVAFLLNPPKKKTQNTGSFFFSFSLQKKSGLLFWFPQRKKRDIFVAEETERQ